MKIRTDDLLRDFSAGLRTREFLSKYALSMGQFEQIVKQLIRDGMLTKEQFREWKAHRPVSVGSARRPAEPLEESVSTASNVETYVIADPEGTNSTALELFSTRRDMMKGAKFKIVLHGKKYSFVVENMLLRGPVAMRTDSREEAVQRKARRDEAVAYISKHGWAAYLENRAFLANFEENGDEAGVRANLVLLHCRNQTYLAALHTPTPAINLYVASSLTSLRQRLSNSIDISEVPL
jgi:hypothetical protein